MLTGVGTCDFTLCDKNAGPQYVDSVCKVDGGLGCKTDGCRFCLTDNDPNVDPNLPRCPPCVCAEMGRTGCTTVQLTHGMAQSRSSASAAARPPPLPPRPLRRRLSSALGDDRVQPPRRVRARGGLPRGRPRASRRHRADVRRRRHVAVDRIRSVRELRGSVREGEARVRGGSMARDLRRLRRNRRAHASGGRPRRHLLAGAHAGRLEALRALSGRAERKMLLSKHAPRADVQRAGGRPQRLSALLPVRVRAMRAINRLDI